MGVDPPCNKNLFYRHSNKMYLAMSAIFEADISDTGQYIVES